MASDATTTPAAEDGSEDVDCVADTPLAKAVRDCASPMPRRAADAKRGPPDEMMYKVIPSDASNSDSSPSVSEDSEDPDDIATGLADEDPDHGSSPTSPTRGLLRHQSMECKFVLPAFRPDLINAYLLDLMLAIRASALEGSAELEGLGDVDELPEEYFKAELKYVLRRPGSSRRVQVKDFAPVVFQAIRNSYGIVGAQYLLSWSQNDVKQYNTEHSYFIYSHDRRYMAKAISQAACHKFINFLPQYYEHVREHPNTLIAPIVGMLRIADHIKPGVKRPTNMYYMVMANICDPTLSLDEVYEIQGDEMRHVELVVDPNEAVKAETKSALGAGAPLACANYRSVPRARTLYMEYDQRSVLMAQLSQDGRLLESGGLNNYTLLVGIHRGKVSREEEHPSMVTTKVPRVVMFQMPANREMANRSTFRVKRKSSMSFDVPLETTNGAEPRSPLRATKGGYYTECDRGNELYWIGIIDVLHERRVRRPSMSQRLRSNSRRSSRDAHARSMNLTSSLRYTVTLSLTTSKHIALVGSDGKVMEDMFLDDSSSASPHLSPNASPGTSIDQPVMLPDSVVGFLGQVHADPPMEPVKGRGGRRRKGTFGLKRGDRKPS